MEGLQRDSWRTEAKALLGITDDQLDAIAVLLGKINAAARKVEARREAGSLLLGKKVLPTFEPTLIAGWFGLVRRHGSGHHTQEGYVEIGGYGERVQLGLFVRKDLADAGTKMLLPGTIVDVREVGGATFLIVESAAGDLAHFDLAQVRAVTCAVLEESPQ